MVEYFVNFQIALSAIFSIMTFFLVGKFYAEFQEFKNKKD